MMDVEHARSEHLADNMDFEALTLMGELGLTFRHAQSVLRRYRRERARLAEDAGNRSDWLSVAGD